MRRGWSDNKEYYIRDFNAKGSSDILDQRRAHEKVGRVQGLLENFVVVHYKSIAEVVQIIQLSYGYLNQNYFEIKKSDGITSTFETRSYDRKPPSGYFWTLT